VIVACWLTTACITGYVVFQTSAHTVASTTAVRARTVAKASRTATQQVAPRGVGAAPATDVIEESPATDVTNEPSNEPVTTPNSTQTAPRSTDPISETGRTRPATLAARYRRVAWRLLELERHFGPSPGAALAERFEWIRLDKALATATSRRLLSATLDELDHQTETARAHACETTRAPRCR
jgi:hypothetical protein